MMLRFLLSLACFSLLCGCGEPTEQYVLPDQVLDFHELFNHNCAGCHGHDGQNGAARPLHDPIFLAVASKETIMGIISIGVRGTAMPAFAKTAGGQLTIEQIQSLAQGIQSNWGKPADLAGVAIPPYSGPDVGDAQRGQAAYETYCARCHPADKPGSVLDPSYLKLVSNQGLRSNIISGPGVPGSHTWHSYSPDHPLTSQEIADVVAFLSTHRNVGGESTK